MDPYLSYQQGYGVQYPPAVPPPNQFYAPPRSTQQYNGYPAAQYSSHYRRPSDPGPQPRAQQQQQLVRRTQTARQPDDETPRELARPRNASLRTGMAPDSIFVSLSSHDILKIGHLTSVRLLDSLRDILLYHWPQGIVGQTNRHDEWTAKFHGGDVWSAGGRHGIMARRLICKLFSLLAQEGYGYLTTVDLGHPMKAPRMVFTSVPPDPDPEYFMISFSLNRRTLTIIDAPEKFAVFLGVALRGNEIPTRSMTESSRWLGPGVYEVVTAARGTGRQDLAALMGVVLKVIATEGYRFEASVPFGRVGLFGLRGRREVWMFRRVAAPRPTPPARRRRH